MPLHRILNPLKSRWKQLFITSWANVIIVNTVKIITDVQFSRSGYQKHFSSPCRPFRGFLLFRSSRRKREEQLCQHLALCQTDSRFRFLSDIGKGLEPTGRASWHVAFRSEANIRSAFALLLFPNASSQLFLLHWLVHALHLCEKQPLSYAHKDYF